MTALLALSLRQRVGLVVLAVTVMGTLLWNTTRSSSNFVALSADRPMTTAESRDVKKKLRAAGLTDFQQSGDQLLVPRDRVADYRTALPDNSPSPHNWAAEWERQNERLNLFSGSRARETSREIARAKHTAAMLRQLPDIQQADVVWDEDAQLGWRQLPRCRATVYLQPTEGRELSLDIIRAVRLAVAGSKKYLDPADVTIMDLERQVTYDGSEASLVGEHLLPQLRVLADLYRRQINDSLHDVAGAEVAVDVDLPHFFDFLANANSESTTTGHVQEATLAAVAPRLLRVTVAVPPSAALPLQTSEARDSLEASLRDRLTQLLNGAGRPEGTSGFDAAQITISLPAVVPPAQQHPKQTLVAAWANLPTPVLYSAGGCAALIALFFLIGRRQRSSSAQRTTKTLAEPHEFEDLARLDQHTLTTLYTQQSPTCWAIALRGASPDVTQRLIASLATQTADELRQHLDDLGPVRLRDVQSSQNRIIDALRQPRHNSGPSTTPSTDVTDPFATPSA